MIDHIILSVADLPRLIAFYEQALAPLGISHYVDYDGTNGHPDLKGFGSDKRTYIWLKNGLPSSEAVHLAFVAESPAAVDAFYEATMAAGARDIISPRARTEYYAGHYAADILDPDGYSVEASPLFSRKPVHGLWVFWYSRRHEIGGSVACSVYGQQLAEM
jgi:catechol 2,3-dioxygenase-like lactoylglutathione lyase family enzyme